jgi:hypothetical protein
VLLFAFSDFLKILRISEKFSKKMASTPPYLKFKVHWTDGGQHSDQFKVEYLLDDSNKT